MISSWVRGLTCATKSDAIRFRNTSQSPYPASDATQTSVYTLRLKLSYAKATSFLLLSNMYFPEGQHDTNSTASIFALDLNIRGILGSSALNRILIRLWSQVILRIRLMKTSDKFCRSFCLRWCLGFLDPRHLCWQCSLGGDITAKFDVSFFLFLHDHSTCVYFMTVGLSNKTSLLWLDLAHIYQT
jgi:hypothetical protein